MYQHSAFKIVPCRLRADPTIHLTPDASVETIISWLDSIFPDEEIDYIAIHDEDQTRLVFDLPHWAAVTYASWSNFVEKLQ